MQLAAAALPAGTIDVVRHLAARASTAVAPPANNPAQAELMQQLLAEGGD